MIRLSAKDLARLGARVQGVIDASAPKGSRGASKPRKRGGAGQTETPAAHAAAGMAAETAAETADGAEAAKGAARGAARRAAGKAAETAAGKSSGRAGREGLAAPERKSTGGRLERRTYEATEITIEINFPPRPKERARTYVDERALVRAFLSAGGDARRFVARIKGRKAEEGDEGRGGIMRTVTPESTRQFEEAVTMVASRAMTAARVARFDCPVEIEVDFRFEGDPATWPTAQADGDLDNLEKAVLDGMNKVVYLDDRLVCRKTGVKRCAEVPGITVRVRPAAP